MSKSSGKYLSPGQLKSRGWTNALMAELLPRPRYYYANGRSVRRWLKADVLEAEQTAAFKDRSEGPQLTGKALFQARAGAERLAARLNESVAAAPFPEDAVGKLAGYYHAGVVQLLPAAHSRKKSRSSQVTGNVNNFLALEHRCDSRQLPAVLMNVVRSGPWLGDHADSGQAAQLIRRWPEVLYAAAAKALADFAQAQPEAKITDFLHKEGFPAAMLLQETLGTVYAVWYVPRLSARAWRFWWH